MSELNIFWKDKNEEKGIVGTFFEAQNLGIVHPSVNSLYGKFIGSHPKSKRGIIIKEGTYIKLLIPSLDGKKKHLVFGTEENLEIVDMEKKLDSGITFQKGRDYYIYMCCDTKKAEDISLTASIVVSLNSSFPLGFNADNSRKIGGFHTLCEDVGIIQDHPLSEYNAGDILPDSIWDLKHRPTCSPEGMAYVKPLDFWADIYIQSGVGINTRSIYKGSATVSRTLHETIEDFFSVGKKPLSNEEFQCAAEGSNQRTNILGSANPVTTGGHKDTGGRRMISNYGLEDCTGVWWQMLREMFYNARLNHWATVDKGSTSWTGANCSGGDWNASNNSGSRASTAYSLSVERNHNVSSRGCAKSKNSI